MILQIIVTPKSFYTSSTDLTVRGWVYNMEDSTRTFKGHQHSVSMMVVDKNVCKSGSRDHVSLLSHVYHTMPGYQARITSHFTSNIFHIFYLCMAHGNLAWPRHDWC